jgi:hypothetical protein
MTFAVGQRVRGRLSGREYVVSNKTTDYALWLDGVPNAVSRTLFEPIADTLRPCFTCGTPTPDEVCEQHKPVVRGYFTPAIACVPDDQPESYDARRKRIAAERNPGQGTHSLCSYCGQGPCACVIEGDDTRGEGIARAVRGLSQVEHRVGAARWEP